VLTKRKPAICTVHANAHIGIIQRASARRSTLARESGSGRVWSDFRPLFPRNCRVRRDRGMGSPMSSPQDSPTRKKQKARRRRKLAVWRQKQEAKAAQAAATPPK
jgi:hypothetical protein